MEPKNSGKSSEQSTRRPIPGLKPPITKFKSVDDISQEEVDAFIEMVRKWRHEGIENESLK
jgi:hypothetical protein